MVYIVNSLQHVIKAALLSVAVISKEYRSLFDFNAHSYCFNVIVLQYHAVKYVMLLHIL